jgi:hypothetical protein
VKRAIRLLRLFWATVALLSLGACDKISMETSSRSINIERTVLRPEISGRITSFSRGHGGGFLLTGGVAPVSAWAAAVNADGSMVWRFPELSDPTRKNTDGMIFNGAAALGGGSALICGVRTSQEGIRENLILILDRHGMLLEERSERATEATPASSGFGACLPWGDGIAVTGSLNDGSRHSQWLVNLDQHGVKRWDKLLPPGASAQPIETADHGLVFSNYIDTPSRMEFVKVDAAGQLSVSRKIDAVGYLVCPPVSPAKVIGLVSYGPKTVRYLLDDHLQDSVAPESVSDVYTHEGFGFALPGGSLLLFGNVSGAAAVELGPSGRIEATRVLPDVTGLAVGGVLALSASEFVTAGIHDSSNSHDVVLNWLTLK